MSPKKISATRNSSRKRAAKKTASSARSANRRSQSNRRTAATNKTTRASNVRSVQKGRPTVGFWEKRHKDQSNVAAIPLIFLVTFFLLIALCFVAASFGDYSLAKIMYAPGSTFSTTIAAFSGLPLAIVLSGAGVLFLCSCQIAHIARSLFAILVGFGLQILAFYVIGVVAKDIFPLPFFTAAGLGMLPVILCDAALMQASVRAEKTQLFLFALFTTLCALLAVVVTKYGLNQLWPRPRMRLIKSGVGATFLPWWKTGDSLRVGIAESGIDPQEFQSFCNYPAASATTLLFMAALPVALPLTRKYQKFLFWIPVAAIAVISIAQMRLGVAFLSDICMGCLATFFIMLVGLYVGYGNRIPQATLAHKAS